ncbi:hypothetical protein M3Y94_01266200 [Aphelenchoides besseyi]|nr:hypothetical protein M3Y94_01266200 [Aphelenchoides besseyi]KAI6222590.1 hypothetical protein M3Y95_00909700 [Aphelenchoides besseyi]
MSFRKPSMIQRSQKRSTSQSSNNRQFNAPVDLLNVTQPLNVQAAIPQNRSSASSSTSQPTGESNFYSELQELLQMKKQLKELTKVVKYQNWHYKALYKLAMSRQKVLDDLRADVERQEAENDRLYESIMKEHKEEWEANIACIYEEDQSIEMEETEASSQCLNVSWMPLSEQLELSNSQLPNVTFDSSFK